MNKYLDRFVKLENSKVWLISLIVGVFYYVSLHDGGSELKDQISVLNQSIQTEEAKKADTEGALKEEQRMKESIGSLSQKYIEISKKLPSVLTSADFSKTIDEVAKATQVEIKSKKQLEIVDKTIVEEIPIQVELKGTYSSLTQFIYFISIEERISRVVEVRINTHKQDVYAKRLNLEMSAIVMGYRSKDTLTKDPKLEPPSQGVVN